MIMPNTPEENSNNGFLSLTEGDCLQIYTCYLGLRTAAESKGQMHLTNPRIVRSCAIHWLGKVGIKATSRTRWETLLTAFRAAFAEVICRKQG